MQRIPFMPWSCAALAAAFALATAAPAQRPDYILTNLIVEDQLVENHPSIGFMRDLDVTPDGSRLVFATAGVFYEDCNNTAYGGAVYTYDYDPGAGTWQLGDVIRRCDVVGYGDEVSISDDGTVLAVAHAAGGSQNTTFMDIYREVDGLWVLDESLSDSGNLIGDSVDVDPTGTRVITVAPLLYFQILKEVGGVWQVELHVDGFIAPPNNSLTFQTYVAIDGDWAAVGAHRLTNGAASEGIDMYHHDGTSWQLAQTVVPPGGIPGSGGSFGDIEIDGTTMILGRDSGYVRIYELDAKTGQWEQVFEHVGTPGLGYDVDIQGDEAVAAVRSGNLYTNLYRRVGGVWQLETALDMPNWTFLDQGRTAAIGGGRFFGGGNMTVNVSRGIVEEYDVPRVICTLDEDFDGLSEVPPSLFEFPQACATSGLAGGELVLDLPVSCAGGNGLHLGLGDVIAGDFDLSVDWSVDALPPIGADTLGSALTMLGLDNQVVARLERFRLSGTLCAPSVDVYKGWDSIAGVGNCVSSIVATTQLAGAFRVRRQGTAWTLYFKDAVNPDWVPLRTATLTDGPVRFALDQWTSSFSGMTTRYDDLVLTCPAAECPGNTNGDDLVDVNDLNAVILDWGTDGSANGGDLTGQLPDSPPDAFVDVNDLNAVIVNWGACP